MDAPISAARARLGRLRPNEPAEWLLLAIVCAGVVLRVLAMLAWSPATTNLADSFPYAEYAARNPLDNPQHPAGYSSLLALIGVLSHEVVVAVILQHLAGIAAGLLLFAAVRRLTGSPWPALAPAATVILGGDQIFLEHSIMSEAAFTLALALACYALVRSYAEPQPWYRWPLAAGGLIAAAATIRSQGLFLAPVAVIALLVWPPASRRPSLIASATVAASFAALMLAYASASALSNGRFEISPAQGWHLYARAAPFADCARFEPPEGTDVLCESVPPERRPGLDFYLFDERSPARSSFGFIGEQDGTLGSFARAALLAQPGDYLSAVWDDVRGYYLPNSYEFRLGQGANLDGLVDWSVATASLTPEEAFRRAANEQGMELFFEPFSVEVNDAVVEVLDAEQRLVRFGALALSIATLLVGLGLFVGPRRQRFGVAVFGLGSLAMLLAASFSVYYNARYTVPIAGPMVAAAAIAVFSLWGARRVRATARSGPAGSRT